MNIDLKTNNYTVVRNFIGEERTSRLGSEYIRYCKENEVAGDSQSLTSFSVHNYLPFLELLCEKTPEVSEIVGETVLPTYTYSRVYHKNGDLKRHKDKDECEISLTLNLFADRQWDIWIETPSGEKRNVTLGPGDAMFYHGCDALTGENHMKENFMSRELFCIMFIVEDLERILTLINRDQV